MHCTANTTPELLTTSTSTSKSITLIVTDSTTLSTRAALAAMDDRLPIMGPHEDPDNLNSPGRGPFVYFNFESGAALQKERQANEPHRLQQVQDALDDYELALEQFQTPADVVIYEAPRCGDMALFLTAIKRNKALVPHVLHVAFTKGLDDLTHCGIVQQLGLEREYSYSSVPRERMNDRSHLLRPSSTSPLRRRTHAWRYGSCDPNSARLLRYSVEALRECADHHAPERMVQCRLARWTMAGGILSKCPSRYLIHVYARGYRVHHNGRRPDATN
jgi:hypothetical protein